MRLCETYSGFWMRGFLWGGEEEEQEEGRDLMRKERERERVLMRKEEESERVMKKGKRERKS